MAGIVATQCGIPLRPFPSNEIDDAPIGFDNKLLNGNSIGEAVSTFLPGVTCLGDILKDNGYTNVFLGGASLNFAGKGKFFRTHGFDKILGREEWIEKGKESMNGWGLYDDDLFKSAKEELDSLAKSGKPYNLTLLTVDTHHVEGFINPSCKKNGTVDFYGIVECTANEVAEFLDYIRASGYLDSTTVVITGDHLAMVNSVYDKIVLEENRTIFNRIFTNESVDHKNRDEIVHFDLYPTVLNSLGFKIDGGRIALGISAFGDLGKGIDENRVSDMESKLLNYSKKYLEFWKRK